jgi:diguanylate cyclase (GGDEF)-like protein
MAIIVMLIAGLLAIFLLWLQGLRQRREFELELATLQASARVEVVTMLRNRQAFSEDLELELMRCARTGRPASLVVVSIEQDPWREHGAQVADAELAGAIRDAVRTIDLAYRIAVDEIALVLPETRARGALTAASRIVEHVVAAGAPVGSVTAGVAELGPGIDRHQLFRKAYCALLSAGRGGRSSVLAYSPELEQLGATGDLAGLGEIEALGSPAA